MTSPGDDFADRLAAIYPRLDVPPGVMAGVLRLPILDSILEELETFSAADHAVLRGRVATELERLAELLLTGMLGTSADGIQRRTRVVELLRRAEGGRLPALVADPEDAFGRELRDMLASDDDLRAALGRVYPLASRATSVVPSARWIGEARQLVGGSDQKALLVDAMRRVLAALMRAEVESRPDILVGALRLANQRFARGLLWLAATSFDAPSETLAAVGLRMGTSGRSDAVVRDTALANTAAALLGASTDEAAVAALASMRLEVTNRNVLKQVDRALEAQAERAGLSVDELVDAALPTVGLDARGRLELERPAATAIVALGTDGHVNVTWSDAKGVTTSEPPESVETSAPDLLADVAATVARIDAALEEERRRLERRLGSERAWSLPAWRRRFDDHPIGRIAVRTLLWSVEASGKSITTLPADSGWLTSNERPLTVEEPATIRLWHPADAGAAEIAAWRATLAARAITQAVQQADRQVFRFDASAASPAADVRHAGAIVDHGRLRALLRGRGWAVPALGAWDQGDEATAWRAFDAGLRAELRYQAPDRTPTGERVERARIVAVRFVRTDAAPASPAGDAATVLVADVPRRVFSESLRDVSLVVAT